MPRSRSSDTIKSRNNTVSNNDPDFFNTFDKPTQIYRYLKTRFIGSPLFLHRNLSYMKGRCVRKKQKRKDFKIDHMLKRKTDQEKEALQNNENLIIAFVRFDDELLKAANVRVETRLEKISHNRRKEGRCDTLPKRIGEPISVVVNSDDNGTEKLPAVCIANKEFDSSGENLNITYQLSFDIESFPHAPRKDDEPPSKYPCIKKTYHAELPVFDKSRRSLLLNGLYNVRALDSKLHRSTRTAYWETLDTKAQICQNWAEEVSEHYPVEDDSNPFTTFEKTPKIQLYMEWKTDLIYGNIPRPKFINDQQNNNNKENKSSINIPATNGMKTNGHNCDIVNSDPTKSFYFQFVVNNSIKQRLGERMDFTCPWCSINCMRLYSLMKHLKLCHARFLFQYVEENHNRRIDVFVNDLYDGSYNGSPHDVLLGSQSGPTRRTVATSIMVYRPRKPTYEMSEFAEIDDGDLDQQRQYISGHNRIYYHSETCIPIMPKELDYDSEGEPDPKWLQRTTKQMIDEFTDVNGGEKELMKLWNLHVMKHGFVGDCQITLACNLFLKEKGKELLQKNLFRNYITHLHSLFDYGLISPKTINESIQTLLEIQKTVLDLEEVKKNRETEVVIWKVRENQHVVQESIAAPSSKLQSLSLTSTKSSAKGPTNTIKTTAKGLPKTGESAKLKNRLP